MHELGVLPSHMRAVMEGLRTVLGFAGVEDRIAVYNYDVWRNNPWKVGERLLPWQSVDWYIEQTRKGSRFGQLHVARLLELLYNEPWQKAEAHYDIVVTCSDLYDDGCNFVIGAAVEGLGTVISVKRFLELDPAAQRECIVTETMHEVGHVFGLVPKTRTENVSHSLGLHCDNMCTMRQGLNVPRDWINITNDRLAGHVFCKTCESDLRRYFSR